VKADRVSYYSTERGEWEEIPLEMVDLDRTKSELAGARIQVAADAKAEAEGARGREAGEEASGQPSHPGRRLLHSRRRDGAYKAGRLKIVNNKTRSVLKVLSPIPTVPGKSTVELDGEHAPLRLSEVRPEFYFRLSDYEGVDIVRLTPKKACAWWRNVSILQLKNDRIVEEKFDKVETFKKQEADLLFRIWPMKPLPPGEYALIQYSDGKLDPQIWDFTIESKSGDRPYASSCSGNTA
jgi:hypothetical protein